MKIGECLDLRNKIRNDLKSEKYDINGIVNVEEEIKKFKYFIDRITEIKKGLD